MPPVTVRSLVCHRDIETALICLPSLERFSQEAVRFALHDDGSLTSADLERLLAVLPSARIISTAEADSIVLEKLRRHPHAAAFRARNVLARKLLDVALISDGPLFFTDSDVLYLRPFRGIFVQEGPSAVFTTGEMDAYSLRPFHILGPRGFRIPRRVNSGVFAVRRYDLDFVDYFLGHPRLQEVFAKMPWWAEQTAWAALGERIGCELWDPAQVAVMEAALKDTPDLAAVHFVTNIRYRLKDFVAALALAPQTSACISIRSRPPVQLRAWHLAATQLELRFKRFRDRGSA